jgi:uncharacterized membrane protein YfcA
MIALMELGISLTIVVVMIGVGALLMLIGLAVVLVTHPLRTLAFLVNKLAALGGGLGLIGTPFAWFVVEHDDKDWNLLFYGSVCLLVGGIMMYGLTEWFLERPTRAERRMMERRTLIDSTPEYVTDTEPPKPRYALKERVDGTYTLAVRVPRNEEQ